MAAGGYKEFVAGETLDQDEINDYLMQGMLVFAGTAARGSAITSPVEGQFAFLTDSDTVTYHDGSDWVELATTPGAAVVGSTTGSPSVGTVSSGGTTYNVYSFTGSGSIIIDEAGFAELLLVGGGGGGGEFWGAGGGAGAHVEVAQAYLGIGTATVVVGAGGLGGVIVGDETQPGNNGEISRVSDFYAPGGGAGGSPLRDSSGVRTAFGFNGGSGGGSGGFNTGSSFTGGSGLSPLGNDGGSSASRAGGGGGGAGASGSNASGDAGGAGGNGTSNSITGSAVTRAGGGGGAGNSSAGSGGTGGGGAGGTGTNAVSGTANTGGGGGGVSDKPDATGNGGSGIVIVRVAV